MPLEPGTVFAGYIVQRVLGVGGMGSVYLVAHPRLPRQEALKLLRPELCADPVFVARFHREAATVARLAHPHILPVHDRGSENGQLWISMPFVEGRDAEVAVQAYPQGMPAARAIQIVGQVGSALDYAHRQQLLHRDVKPANILLAVGPELDGPEWSYLTDFGIAKATDESVGLTATGSVVATFAYASPEQIEGRRLDHRSDIYSLGGVLVTLLTGSAPYPGASIAAALNGHLNLPPPRPSRLVQGLPAGLDEVVATAMAKDPELRYQTCRALVEAARGALASAWSAGQALGESASRAESMPASTEVNGHAADRNRNTVHQADPHVTLLNPAEPPGTAEPIQESTVLRGRPPGRTPRRFGVDEIPAPQLPSPDPPIRQRNRRWWAVLTAVLVVAVVGLGVVFVRSWLPGATGGDGTTAGTSAAGQVPGSGIEAASVSAAAAGGAVAWGSGKFGQLGNGGVTNSPVTVQVSGLTGVSAVAGGAFAGYALLRDGTVMAWGEGRSGQLGNGATTDSAVPVKVSGLAGVSAIAGGGSNGYALLGDGTVMAWGEGRFGQLGNGTTSASATPVRVPGLAGVTAIAGGGYSAYALLGDGTVVAWGAGRAGQLGNGAYAGSSVPVKVAGLAGVTAIAAGTATGYALLGDGTVLAWGEGLAGQRGDGQLRSSGAPVQVSGLTGATAIAGGGSSGYALRSDGTVVAWGVGANGQLGNGAQTLSLVPVQVTGLTGATAIAAGNANGYALLGGGTVVSWGRGTSGQLGNGATADSLIPVQVADLTGVVAIASSYDTGYALP